MRNSFSKVQCFLFALSILALTGCGATSTTTAANPTGNTTQLTAKVVGLLSDSVATVRLQVTGAAIPTARQDFAGKTGGTIEVYPGSALIVTAQAFDATSVMLSEGAVTDVTVVAGTPTTVTITMNPPVVKTADVTCLGCHETTRDITGQNLLADFKQSGHYTNLAWTANQKYTGVTGTGCAGCHGTKHDDTNPAASGRCFECHTTLGLNHQNVKSTIAGEVNPARYLNANNTNCSACHEPHNPINGAGKDERKAWADSGHGDTTGLAWAHYDFTIRDECNRCHTATGFVKAESNGFTDTKATSTTVSSGKEVLACNACHSDNKFTMRTAGAFTAKYNGGNSPKTFPNVGTSNLCIACHSAVEGGDAVALSTGDFSNKSFVNSHYMAAAATMYMSNAFVNFTTQTTLVPTNTENIPVYTYSATKSYNTYNQPDNLTVPSYGIVGGTSSTHRKVGTPLIAGSETYLPKFESDGVTPGKAIATNGPCVTCHMQGDNPVAGDTAENSNVPVPAFRPGKGHSLKIDQATAQQVCLPCHGEQHLDGGDGFGNAKYTATVDLATLESAMLEPQKECFQNGLNLLKQILVTKYMIKYDPAVYPYFYDLQKTGTPAMMDWTRSAVAGLTDAAVAAFGSTTLTAIPAGGLTQAQAKRLMGACFNLNLLTRDPAANVHARTFTQRLVYDALDFLDNNAMDFTALTSSRALNPTIYHGTNVNVFASDGTLATESMIWMSGTHYSAAQSASATKGTDLVPMKLHP
jgi:hypothetical protein